MIHYVFVYLIIHKRPSTKDEITKQQQKWQRQSKVPIKVQNIETSNHNIESSCLHPELSHLNESFDYFYKTTNFKFL